MRNRRSAEMFASRLDRLKEVFDTMYSGEKALKLFSINIHTIDRKDNSILVKFKNENKVERHVFFFSNKEQRLELVAKVLELYFKKEPGANNESQFVKKYGLDIQKSPLENAKKLINTLIRNRRIYRMNQKLSEQELAFGGDTSFLERSSFAKRVKEQLRDTGYLPQK